MRAYKVTTRYIVSVFKKKVSFLGYLYKEIPFPKENWKV